MNIHEYQAQNLFEKFKIPVPAGVAIKIGDDASSIIEALDFDRICVKAQIHAGGRGKGYFKNDLGYGGVKIANSKAEAADIAKSMLGNTLVTKQTGDAGRIVNAVYLVKPVEIEHEYYVAILLDRKLRRPTLIISTEGGMDIEIVAEKFPEKLHKVAIDPLFGLKSYQTTELAYKIGLGKDQANELSHLLLNLHKLFTQMDCSLAEVNPLVLVKDGHFVAIDSKVTFDDNALCRHQEILELRDVNEEDPKETEAAKYNLNYIALDGSIACLVNGAGLAMATMDIIKYYGGSPANFLDVGGGANEEQITHAFEIILGDSHVRGILVNIFGGIVRCDVVAQGIINAANATKLSLPLVVRLEGTNVERGKQLLSESGLQIASAADLDGAAKQIVALAK
ncbi:MAG: ADP-forming succinate--CoA ligase subunit beta [Puniceicoccales bacterium]|jgi:succinyl-CoA synthetase beta subunit|nr:ADP-forming succinate--CoA ligase subunit beta [Puniceicoccales bacterium]